MGLAMPGKVAGGAIRLSTVLANEALRVFRPLLARVILAISRESGVRVFVVCAYDDVARVLGQHDLHRPRTLPRLLLGPNPAQTDAGGRHGPAGGLVEAAALEPRGEDLGGELLVLELALGGQADVRQLGQVEELAGKDLGLDCLPALLLFPWERSSFDGG